MKYCTKCVMPDTKPELTFDEEGVCNACRSHERKIDDIDWKEREKEFEEMIKAVRDTEKLLGKVDYSMTEKKKKSRQFARSLYVSKDIKKGEIFSEENIRSVRPGYGMHPKYLKDVLGKVAEKDYEFGERLNTIF